MVVSFSLSHRGRRIHPPPPPPAPASAHAADDWRPHGAASLDVPHPSPHPPCEAATVSRLDPGIVARSELPDRNETNPSESDLQPSFALNLFPDGYSFGELGKGMFSYLIDDDPKKRPYSRASKALLSDIEHGCLPQDILHGISCKFQNGSTLCEVRDYRSVFSNGDDYSGDDFPRVNRVHLRLGTECVVKDLPSIANASWTYHDQLTAESIILSALQPRLHLDPTPCLEMLCNSSAKKIDLGLNKGKDTSVLIMPTDPPENCKPKEFNNCEEPDIEKILSEAILTTQRHGLNEKAAKTDVLERSSILPPCEFFHPENIEEITSMRDETMTCNVPDGATSTWKIRRLTFHPSQYSRLVDEPQYTLCLLDSEALDHQITVGAIYGDEHIHISTFPNSSHAEKFVDQFISLMKRDGYNLYNDEVCNESSEHSQVIYGILLLWPSLLYRPNQPSGFRRWSQRC
nr:unnamed protein product [Digitaria exilis]